jgi:hypothetical protein
MRLCHPCRTGMGILPFGARTKYIPAWEVCASRLTKCELRYVNLRRFVIATAKVRSGKGMENDGA